MAEVKTFWNEWGRNSGQLQILWYNWFILWLKLEYKKIYKKINKRYKVNVRKASLKKKLFHTDPVTSQWVYNTEKNRRDELWITVSAAIYIKGHF